MAVVCRIGAPRENSQRSRGVHDDWVFKLRFFLSVGPGKLHGCSSRRRLQDVQWIEPHRTASPRGAWGLGYVTFHCPRRLEHELIAIVCDIPHLVVMMSVYAKPHQPRLAIGRMALVNVDSATEVAHAGH